MSTTVNGKAYSFRETLPANCPPTGAGFLTKQTVLRLVPASSVCDDDFKSYAALGKKCCGNTSPCVHAACSVFAETSPRHGVTDLTKLPKLKNKKFLARLTVDGTSGFAEISNQSSHISLWMFASFDPVKAVVKVEALP